MGSTLETVVFYFLAAFIIAMSIMTVTTQRIVRSATYLLFVLFERGVESGLFLDESQ